MASSDVDPQVVQMENAMEMMIDFVPNLLTVMGDDDSKDEAETSIQEVRQYLLQLIQEEEVYNDSLVALSEVRLQVAEAAAQNDKIDVDTDAIYRQVFKQVQENKDGPVDYKRHPKMLKFERLVSNQLRDGSVEDDDDLVMTSEKVSIVDPLTKKVMSDPVKNTNCGHSYERQTILEVISRQKMKCPMPGCPNATYIHKNHLVDNTQLRNYIRKTQENE